MPVPVKKRATDKVIANNGYYIHSNPPRVLQLNSAQIKLVIRSGDLDKLENLVLEGYGKKLIGEYSADYKTRTFLKNVPSLMTKISLLHDAVNSGRLEELQALLEEEPIDKRKRIVMGKDDSGVGLLHKAVYYDLRNIYKYLIDKYPHMISLRDADGRTAYHYTPMCKDVANIQKLLISAGADSSCVDSKQHTAKYYMSHVQELELPNQQKSTVNSSKNSSCLDGLNFKKSNIRIWIHQRNLQNLQQVVWEGHGFKLLVEHSNNARIKKFLEAVPHIMGLIKDIHTDVINDDLENLKQRVSAPIPPIVLTGKDANGLTALHKAAGLGRQEIAEFVVTQHPESINLTDAEGRTPLHYAALAKDDGKITNFLLENGADESVLDNKQKTAAYYKTRPSELDAKLLNVVPEAPRIAKESFLSTFDWNLLLNATTPTEETHRSSKKLDNDSGKEREEEAKTEDKPPEEEPAEETVAEEKAEDEAENSNNSPVEGDDNNNDNTDDKETEDEPQNEEAKEPVEEPEVVQEEEDNPENNAEENKVEDEEQADEVDNNNAEEINEENGSKPASARSRPATATEPEVEPEGVIEGVVNGEDEVETLNEQGQEGETEDNVDASDVTALVESGNMEKLAALVLNGEGEKLIGQSSDNAELQSFLDNVSVYMSKINRIHVAAREGSLRDLQAALDRRKFAIAKDKISPNGASPLHTAVIFGNTSIVRYLAGRFPETAQVTDDNGRTPLHYASVMADNGHYYNLLIHLGADSRFEDKFGHTPEYYRVHQDKFSHKMLLNEYGAEEGLAEQILSDKVPEDTYSARKDLDDEDMLNVLERCYNVLHGHRNSVATSAASTASSATQHSTNSSLITKHTKRCNFEMVKARLTKLDHSLYDVIWPSVKKLPSELSFRVALEQDFPAGIIAPDVYVYKVFGGYMEPIIKDYNSLDIHVDLTAHPQSKFTEQEEGKSIEIEYDLDPQNRWIISGTLDCTRNLEDYELPKSLNVDQLEKVERLVTTVLLTNDAARALYPNASDQDLAEGYGVYYTMNEVLEEPSEARVILASNGLLIPLWNIPESDRLHGKHWPYGRGVFISNGNNLAVWVNVLDHIRIVTCSPHSKPGNVGLIYSRMVRLIQVLNQHLAFKRDDRLGFLSARPTVVGNTLQFNFTVRFPNLIKEPANLRHLCLVRGLTYNRKTSTGDVVRIGNQQCLGITEMQSFEDFTTAVVNILQLEKDMAVSNSLHIAAAFVNIFRKKKHALVTAE